MSRSFLVPLDHPDIPSRRNGKPDQLYVLDQTSLGHFNSTPPDNILQEITLPNGHNTTTVIAGMFSKAAYFNGRVYVLAINDFLRAYTVNAAAPFLSPPHPATRAHTFGSRLTPSFPQDSSNGIVWVLNTQQQFSQLWHPWSGTTVCLRRHHAGPLQQRRLHWRHQCRPQRRKICRTDHRQRQGLRRRPRCRNRLRPPPLVSAQQHGPRRTDNVSPLEATLTRKWGVVGRHPRSGRLYGPLAEVARLSVLTRSPVLPTL